MACGQPGLPGIALIDASFHPPTANRDPKAEFSVTHIPGAVFFDINVIADKETVLPHMLPDAHQLRPMWARLAYQTMIMSSVMMPMEARWLPCGPSGCSRFSDTQTSPTSRRTTPMRAEGGHGQRNVTPQPTDYSASDFKIDRVKMRMTSAKISSANCLSCRCSVSWAFQRQRTGTPGRHARGSCSGFHQPSVSEPASHGQIYALRSADEILAVIQGAGIDPEAPIISSCGSGNGGRSLCTASTRP